MIYNKECSFLVGFPSRNKAEGGRICASEVVSRLLELLKERKATEEDGYFLAVTKLTAIGTLQPCSPHFSLPVKFCCRTYIPERGDVMIATVYGLRRIGVLMKCGPLLAVLLPGWRMGDYSYVEGEKPFFLSSDGSRIEVGSAIRCKVLRTRWDSFPGETIIRDFQILVTIRRTSLGPIQSAGADAEELETLCDD